MTTSAGQHHGDPVTCSNKACNQEIGRLYGIADGLFALQVGAVIIREGHSMFCAHCGQAIHWSMNDQKLERLLKQAIGRDLTEAKKA